MKTNGFGGRTLNKKAVILSNDPEHPQLTLTMSGKVEKFVTVLPRIVRLVGAVGQPMKQIVSIIPEKKYPFKIVEAKTEQGKNIRFKLEEHLQAPNPRYVLSVEDISNQKGRYYDVIHLKTDSNIRPSIDIRVYGNRYEKREPKKG